MKTLVNMIIIFFNAFPPSAALEAPVLVSPFRALAATFILSPTLVDHRTGA